MSIYVTISLSVERYISVMYPFLAIRHRSGRSCLFLATPGMVFSLLFTLPNYFILSTEPITIFEMFENDSVLDDIHSWKPEIAQPRLRLVWANWRNNQAFVTVGATLSFRLI